MGNFVRLFCRVYCGRGLCPHPHCLCPCLCCRLRGWCPCCYLRRRSSLLTLWSTRIARCLRWEISAIGEKNPLKVLDLSHNTWDTIVMSYTWKKEVNWRIIFPIHLLDVVLPLTYAMSLTYHIIDADWKQQLKSQISSHLGCRKNSWEVLNWSGIQRVFFNHHG